MIQSAANGQDPVTKAEFNHAMGLVWEKFEQVDRRFDVLTDDVRDVKSHFGILHEDMMHQFKLVLECLDPTRAKVEDHERRIRGLERELPVLKDAVSLRR